MPLNIMVIIFAASGRDRGATATRLAAARERLAARAALNLRLVQRYWGEDG